MASDRVKNLISQAKNTAFYNEVLIPELDRRLAMYDELMSNVDPWKRYGFVEAYLAIKSFKLSLELSSSSDSDEEIERIPGEITGPAK